MNCKKILKILNLTFNNYKPNLYYSIIRKTFSLKNASSYDNVSSTPEERLNTKAKNVGSSTNQTQNYEKHIFGKNRNDETDDVNMSKDLENLFDNLESTNSLYLENINNPESTNLKIKEMSYNDFLRESDSLILLLKNAFEDLLQDDKKLTLICDRHMNFITVDVKGVGTYVIAKELESKIIGVTSPLSGLFKYKYDPVSRYWISAKDNHLMDELLIREFCHHSKGLLIINH